MAITRAAASTARPRTWPPSSRVLSGKESDASVTGAPAAFGWVPALGAGVTVGKRPPGSVVGPGRKGSAAEEAATPLGVKGRMPPGSVAPRLDDAPADPAAAPDVADAFGAVAEISALTEAGDAVVAEVALALAVRVACWPDLAVFGTATVASSSSACADARVPTVQVAPLADGQTENRGVTAAVTLPLAVTVMLLAVPPEGQTHIA